MRESSKQVLAITAITLLLVGSLFVYLKMISPAYERFEKEEASRQEKEEQIKLLNQYKNKFENLVSRYESFGASLEAINAALPVSAEPATILATLEAIARKNSITISSLVFKEIEPAEEQSVESSTTTASLYKAPNILEISITSLGSYESFKNFIKDLETEIRLMDIAGLKFQPTNVNPTPKAKSSANYFQFDITLHTYYQPIK